MSPDVFADWILRSLATGAVAVALVHLCPASWRGWFRRAVPVAAFLALLALAFWLVQPNLRWEVLPPANLPQVPVETWVVSLWGLGVLVCLVRFGFGLRAIRQILRASRPVPGREWRELLGECQDALRLQGKVRLRLAGCNFVPSATGIWRRAILLPDEALGWTAEQRRLVLLHELGHFQRGDLWKDALARLTCALHWFNPFAWILQRQLAVEREYACDALVVEHGVRPRDYAMALWHMATRASRRPAASAVFIAMASPRGGKLEQRVQRILEAGRKAGVWLRIVDASFCAVLAALLIACTACKPVMRMITTGGNGWTSGEISARLAADPFPAD